MKIFLLLLLAFCLSASATKPELAVYYESMCKGCRDFIHLVLHPAYPKISQYLDVRFIAYGNAETVGDHIECQHGEEECQANVVQACTVHYIKDTAMQVNLLSCMAAADRPVQAGPECFKQFHLDFKQVQKCSDGPEGQKLHLKNGEDQHSLKPYPDYMPYHTWNGKGGDHISDEMDRLGVIGYLCEYFYNNELDVCNK